MTSRPLTRESSIKNNFLFLTIVFVELSFNLTPKLLIFCEGSIKVRLRNGFLSIQVQNFYSLVLHNLEQLATPESGTGTTKSASISVSFASSEPSFFLYSYAHLPFD